MANGSRTTVPPASSAPSNGYDDRPRNRVHADCEGFFDMSKTSSLPELLRLCLWDLRAGCEDLAGRLPGIASQASHDALRRSLEDCVTGAQARAARLSETDLPNEGPDNLWMAGILDDSERDTDSIEPGTLLDLAMIGAIRKALMAELASVATAEAVATSLGKGDVLHVLAANRAALQSENAALERLLGTLA